MHASLTHKLVGLNQHVSNCFEHQSPLSNLFEDAKDACDVKKAIAIQEMSWSYAHHIAAKFQPMP